MSRFSLSFRPLARRLRVWWWGRQGRRRLRRGEVQAAIQAFRRALARDPDSFRPLIDLSIAYLCARDVAQAHAALRRARNCDPARFALRAGRLLGRWGFELPRTQAVPRPTPVVQAARRTDAAPRRRSDKAASSSLPFGDCRDLDEYARFRAMPPITPAEIEALDWDRVIGDFFQD